VEMTWAGLAVMGFVLGSIPFSLLLVRWQRGLDVRSYGDGNPGAANAWKAGGFRTGMAAGVLDFLKGAVPVGLARFFVGTGGWRIIPVAVAPLLGSAFSPFLRFRGGKSIAVTFGIWTGLLMFEGPLALGLCLAFFSAFLASDAWSAMLGFTGFLAYLIIRRAEPEMLAVWAVNALVLAWKHAPDLRRPLRPRTFLHRPAGRTTGGLK